MNNCLDISVSAFRDARSPDNPVSVPLLSWLTCDEYRDEIMAIRATSDKKVRSELKKKLPAIIPSGIFSRREALGLITSSGLMQFDIDGVPDPEALKHEISKIVNVAYVGLSVSGNGLWGIIPITSPADHSGHFRALQQDFAKYDIKLDSVCQDVCRLRFMSYDPDAYFNPSAKPYSRIYKYVPPPAPKYPRPTDASSTRANVEKIISLMATHSIDVTASYGEEWLPIISALANEFGEGGRSYGHEVSRFNPNYTPAETDKLFTDCIKGRYKYTIGSFFEITQRYGLKYISQ